MSWLRKLFGTGSSKSSMRQGNRVLVKDFRQSSEECIAILRRCRTRDQVIQGLLRIAESGHDVSPVADNAARQLAANSGLDAFRIRDDFIRQMEAFLSSARGL
jgi:hypothetical protein